MPEQNERGSNSAPRKFKRTDSDAEFSQKYFTLLLGSYRTMNEKVNDTAALAEAERIAKIPVEEITWEEIYNFELCMLKLAPLTTLRRRAWALREEYGEIANAAEKAEYIASHPPDPSLETVKEVDLREDLVKLQEELNWAYTVLWVQEEFRSKLTRTVVCITFGCIALFGGIVLSLGGFSEKLTLLAVIFCGMVGGCVNTVRRIQKTNLEGNSDLNLIQLEQGKLSVIVSPFLGGIFAVVLYALFASSYIKSGLFPDYTSPAPPSDLLYGVFPILHGTELAKLLVWSFIAGFAEQFVPDRLDQLTARAKSDEEKERATPVPIRTSSDVDRIRDMIQNLPKQPDA